MRKAPNISRRFEELKAEADRVLATKHTLTGDLGGTYVDNDLMLEWRVKARHFIAIVASDTSDHYRQFVQFEEPQGMRENIAELRQLMAVMNAVRDDFEGGYLSKYRALNQAEVFSTELDQARELLAAGYKCPSAVIGGVVLETAPRDLCGRIGLPTGKLDRMNADLAKAETYNKLVQKRITGVAEVRNNAAHRRDDRYVDDDVRDLIDYTQRFLEDHF